MHAYAGMTEEEMYYERMRGGPGMPGGAGGPPQGTEDKYLSYAEIAFQDDPVRFPPTTHTPARCRDDRHDVGTSVAFR